MKEDRDTEVGRLQKQVATPKKTPIEEFRSSNDFQEVVKLMFSKYFGKGFIFCKRQLTRHHLDLGIDLEGMGIDQDLLEEEEDAAEEKGEKKEEKEKEESGRTISAIFLLKYF